MSENRRIIRCMMSGDRGQRPPAWCSWEGSAVPKMVSDHMTHAHDYRPSVIDEYLSDPWYADESREDWRARYYSDRVSGGGYVPRGFAMLHGLTRHPSDEPDEYCDHPNGFGPNGCPCGKGQPDENEPDTFRNLRTGKDEETARCDLCPGNVRAPINALPRHLEVEHPDSKIMRCPLGGPCDTFHTKSVSNVANHMRIVHGLADADAAPYIEDPWMASESRAAWQQRTLCTKVPGLVFRVHKEIPFKHNGVTTDLYRCKSKDPHPVHLWQPGPNTEFFTCLGALTPQEQDNVPDGIWSHSVDCPGGCGNAYVKGNLRRHLQTVHSWTGDMWEDWTEETNFLELPTVPNSVLDDMEALGQRAKRKMADFLNPVITMEEIMADHLAETSFGGVGEVLQQWWLDRAKEEAQAVVPKAVTYGSNSLLQLGRKMAQLQGREASDEEAMELGCWVYAVGKIERWTDAVMRGERPSDDTLYDIGIYIKMAQRIRDAGSWPGLPTT